MTAAPEDAFVFNIVWTGRVFPFLRYFVASQLAQSTARFRFVVNGCPPEQIALMEGFAERYPDRVEEVLVVCEGMERHGIALDITLRDRDDGDYFCFIDPDIIALGPFVESFAARLGAGAAGVTSGRGIWRDDDVLPPDQAGVSGEYFYAPDGFLFGSPHFAMYRRDQLIETRDRWDVGFGFAGPDLSDAAVARLEATGRKYLVYDTGKLMNIFLQDDGGVLEHFEHPNLLHIGGMSHYLSPPDGGGGADGDWIPGEETWPWPVTRLEVARFAAAVLRAVSVGAAAPLVPAAVDPGIAPRLERVRRELIALVETYQPMLDPI